MIVIIMVLDHFQHIFLLSRSNTQPVYSVLYNTLHDVSGF